ncbi:dTDP-4-dehydrorhamnose 3,5-epimerase family protein [Candidatus Microgenomates bacterium]|nr:dTDP-4-dehydrorhamnose 3,5-epimerase family protein [Candidatus Microgenomates bacterium]
MSDKLPAEIKNKIYTQDYSPKTPLEGVEIKEIKNFPGEDGDFSEILRLKNGRTELFPDFELVQINRALVFPKSVKAWHLHFLQDEIWYVTPQDHLLVGLWDLREKSATQNKTMRVILGGTSSRLLFIPRGVAHGCVNLSRKATQIYYFVSNNFNPASPDEKRIPWDSLGADFWQAQRD